jgi:CHASE2 domain-containing sensor protein
LRDAPAWLDVVLTILIAALVPLTRPASVRRTLLTGGVIAAIYSLAAMLAFLAGWVIAVVVPVAALALSTAVTAWLNAPRRRTRHDESPPAGGPSTAKSQTPKLRPRLPGRAGL